MNISKKEKKAISFLLENIFDVEHGNKSLFSHLYNTFFILKKMNAPEDICLAGLLHSVLGTDFYKNETNISLYDIENLIPDYSKKLIDIFKMKDRLDKCLDLNNSLELKTRIDLLYIIYANDFDQFGNVENEKTYEYFNFINNKIIDFSKEFNNEV